MKPILNKEMVLEFLSEENAKITGEGKTLTELYEQAGQQQMLRKLLELTKTCI